jgi:hypothetical protein
MLHILLKAAAVIAIGSFAFAAPASALMPPAASGPASLVVPVQDQENEEVWRDLRPDVTPPEAAVGKKEEAPKGSAAEPPMEEGSGDVENDEVLRDLRTEESPPEGE